VGIRASGGNFVIGISPSAVFTIRLDGTHRREVQYETEHRVSRNPVWTQWPD
jgi:hypothetical protein